MKNEKACSGEGTAQTMPKAGAAQAAAKTGAGRTGHVPDCPCRHKNTPRSMELQADMQKRLNRAIGQLTGVSEMVLAEHMRTCVVEEVRAGNDEVIDEVMALMRRFSK